MTQKTKKSSSGGQHSELQTPEIQVLQTPAKKILQKYSWQFPVLTNEYGTWTTPSVVKC